MKNALYIIFLAISLNACGGSSDEKAKSEQTNEDNSLNMATFEKLQNGMTLPEIEKTLGMKGKLGASAGDGQAKFESYTFQEGTIDIKVVSISLQGGKLVAKTQIGL